MCGWLDVKLQANKHNVINTKHAKYDRRAAKLTHVRQIELKGTQQKLPSLLEAAPVTSTEALNGRAYAAERAETYTAKVSIIGCRGTTTEAQNVANAVAVAEAVAIAVAA